MTEHDDSDQEMTDEERRALEEAREAQDEALYQLARLKQVEAGGDDLTRDEWRRRGEDDQ